MQLCEIHNGDIIPSLELNVKGNIESYAQQIGDIFEGPGAKKDQEIIDDTLGNETINLIAENHDIEGTVLSISKNLVLSHLTINQFEILARAKRYISEQNIKCVLKQTSNNAQNMSMDMYKMSAQRQQALSLMCRIYIGSIAFDLSEDNVKQVFKPFGPIRSVSMSYDLITLKHKGFAFLEFENPEAAELAVQQMTGFMMASRNIKVGRPSNMPQAQPIIEEIKREAEPYNRLYVASVHTDLSEDDIKSVFEAFGKIKSCKLATIPLTNKHKGYAYIEYETKQACTDAINSMNLFDLGGQLLRVGKCVTTPNLIAAITGTALPSPTSNATPPSSLTTATAVGKTPDLHFDEDDGDQHIISGFEGADGNNSDIERKKRKKGDKDASSPKSGKENHQSEVSASGTGVGGSKSSKFLVKLPQGSSFFPPPPTVAENICLSTKPFQNSNKEKADKGSKTRTDEDSYYKDVEMKLKKIDDSEDVSISGRKARHMVMQKLMKKTESRILCLKNMVGPEDIDSALESEVREECSKYGKVVKVIVHQEMNELGAASGQSRTQLYDPLTPSNENDNFDDDIIVKIFVEFSSHPDVLNAKSALDGRYFGGRTVQAEAYDQMAYDEGDLSL